MIRILLIFTLLVPVTGQAQHYTANWRQDALEMIEDGRLDRAKALLQDASTRMNLISQPIERINQGRFLGEAYHKLGKKAQARESFEKAMNASLKLTPVWRSLSAVISVLELQATTDDLDDSRVLIQKSLDAKLLPRMSKDKYATEIGRYVKRFEKATRAQVYQLIDQLRTIDKAKVRKKAFFALTELDFAPFTGEGRRAETTMPLGMGDFERFLWFSVRSKYFANSGERFQFEQQVAAMQAAYDRLAQEKQQKYRKIYRMVVKLDYTLPKPAVAAKVESKSKMKVLDLAPPSNSELEDIFYGRQVEE
ncbi:MAG: hypothetical protein P8P30_02765 [Rickettsiales bacterium]|nr:hypothetical protein [Rickettsiales bacterium]